ncbi:LacI family transcriptional regulator [Paenibacillus lycopersici]|uniref:LacI family transcriptional regulator n=1 Tax=Paenibacillus lycopersici TaxID=2704462 RepID=A0A6C0G1S0_9BACL|nr:LacI family DNA-binding transcriptional regulator [Paenibacillus lycopersici]QHT61284.1 LacI family transcriptional regulator [Paenibacillus lycopersici]
MKTTIKEVAKEAGVSISTVSRVLNGRDRVSRHTINRVREVIEKLQFQPDFVARTMIMKRTSTIGLIVPQLSNEYWALMSEVIQDELWARGYTTLICSTDNEPDKENAYLRMCSERRMDGVIYCSSPHYGLAAGEQIEALKTAGIPLVSLDPNIAGVSCVIGDHLQGTYIAVEHLIRLGYGRIAYIGGPAVSIEREFGYRKALMMHGYTVDESLIRVVQGQSFADGYEGLQSLRASGIAFDALFCGNDLLAFGAIKAMEEAGIRVPEDVAVVGYDDIFSARLFKPSLTTVRQPIQDIGQELVQLLLASLETEPERRTVRKIVIPTELIVRESSGSGQMKA